MCITHIGVTIMKEKKCALCDTKMMIKGCFINKDPIFILFLSSLYLKMNRYWSHILEE